MAIQHKVPYVTTTAAALASVEGIAAMRAGRRPPRSLQQYHAIARSAAIARTAAR
jgi:carbamoyl-phosphate synthase large subunit